jgi:hypothetical protein
MAAFAVLMAARDALIHKIAMSFLIFIVLKY